MIKKRNKNHRQWRKMATSCHTSVSVSSSHFSLSSLPGLALLLSLCPKPLQILTFSYVSSFFADFSFRPSSPMYILYPFLLPLLRTHIGTNPSAVTYTHTRTHPSAVMACIQQIHWAKPRASVKIYEEHK